MLAYKVKQRFTHLTLHVFEKNSDIGGIWHESYCAISTGNALKAVTLVGKLILYSTPLDPGCRCDMSAHSYVYYFEGKPD